MIPGIVLVAWALLTTTASAQVTGGEPAPVATGQPAPAFSLSSSEVFTTSSRPHVVLTFQQLGQLEFRVYRVKDVDRFFLGLRDPHVLGSPEPYVPQEPTLIERVAAWKSRQREGLRAFFRGQFSPVYRRSRNVARDRERLAQRRIVTNLTQFAQLPLLNREQLVVAWRELLPRTREPEVRRIPLELPGSGVYLVEAVHARLRAHTIVVVSDVGVLTKTAPGQVVAWAVHRRTGAPQPDCRVSTIANRREAAASSTGADGVATLGLDPAPDGDALLALVRCGNEVVVADPGGFYLREPGTELVGYVYTDRPIYRPGHTVHTRAVLRWRERGLLRAFDRPDVEISVLDPTEKVIYRESRPVDAFGAASASLVLSGAAALGDYTVRITSGDTQASGTFEVQEYRKPEFEVSVAPASPFVVQGQQARMTFSARYFFGQPVAHGRVEYVVHRGYYWSPWRWVDQPDDEAAGAPAFYGGEQVSEAHTTLDATGNASVLIPMPQDPESRDLTIRVEARVRDASGREVAAHGTIVAPWARFLLALATDTYLHRPGATATVRVRAVDYKGQPQPNTKIEFALERLTYEGGRYERPSGTVVQRATATTDAAGSSAWKLTVPDNPGDYRVTASTWADGRRVTAETSIYVPDPSESLYESPDRMLELVADRATYQPGDTARLVLRGERVTTPVLVTKEREETTWHRVVAPPAEGTIEVPIDEDDLGDVWVNVAFVRDDKLYRAERRVRVPPTARTLNVSVEAAAAVARPRDPATFTVKITDAHGQPVRAQFSLGVVDEAIYTLKPDTTPDPARYFYRRGYSRVGTQFSRDYSFVGYSGAAQLQLAQRRRAFSLADFKGERPQRAEVRREFPDAILWVADATTNSQGVATVQVNYPDALTTWRLTARAVTEDTKAGSTIARTTVTKDIILRLPVPRFLTEGDSMQLPVVAHNYHQEPRTLDVSVQATGVAAVTPPAQPVKVEVAPSGEQTTTWTFRADTAGTATFSGSAITSDDADRLEVSFPILPFGLRRDITQSGSISGGTQGVQLDVPTASNTAGRRIEVTLAPTLAGSMLGALDELSSYPYGCTEQTLSSFLPNLLVVRALDRLKIAPAERLRSLDQFAGQGLRRLLAYQHESGGWGWWPTDEDHPFMTAYALYGLLQAREAGMSVDQQKLISAALATTRLHAKYPRAIPDLKAYVAFVLGQASSANIPGLDAAMRDNWSTSDVHTELWNARDRMSSYGRALLALALQATKDTRADTLVNALVDEAQTQGDLAWWPSTVDPLLDERVDTSVEATAFAMQAIAMKQPDHPVLDRAVRWLLAQRHSGAWWGTTKQTAMALYGLLAVMEGRGDRPTTFSVDVRVNGATAGTHTFTPESWTSPEPARVSAEARAGSNDIAIELRGGGTLYWTATARYYDAREPIERSGSRVLALKREYFSLEPVNAKGRIVYRTQPFSGRARTGDVVLVRLTAAGATDWRYLVVDDPIPAGMEAVREPEAFEISPAASWWTASRREYRDARVVQFQESFANGRYEFHYLLKAVTPGTYRAMPAQILPMYVPGVSASTTTQQVTIDPEGTPTAPSSSAAPGIVPAARSREAGLR